MTGRTDTDATSYERKQNFNPLVRWLHSFRYKVILEVFADLERELDGRAIRVLEIGSAEGKLFDLVNQRFRIDYTGIEVRYGLAEVSRKRYGDLANFRVIVGSAADPKVFVDVGRPDIVVALETLEHIPEHHVVRIVEGIAALQPRILACSVPVEVGPAIWAKNVGSWLVGYMRHREYRWAETFWAGLYQLDRLPPHSLGHRGFDWRWLAHTIRHNLEIVRIRRFPSPFLPASCSTSVFFLARPRHEPVDPPDN